MRPGRLGWLAVAALLAACAPQDLDGDGVAAPHDCDDRNPRVAPGLEERCDGIDNDCDGVIDEDASADGVVWYADADGDGFGDPGRALAACAPGPGWVKVAGDCDDEDARTHPGAPEPACGPDRDCDGLSGDDDGDGDGVSACEGDCDDADPDAHPGAAERCSGRDEDCDGEVDEGAALGASDWFPDLDGDGWGRDAPSTRACEAPAGHVDRPGDCDDADPGTHPGAEERCGGGDEDCDGEVDEDAVDAPHWYADADGDGFGAGDPVRACTPPAGYAARDGDCDDADPEVSPAAEERCDGRDRDCDGRVDADAVDAPTWFLDRDKDGYGEEGSEERACADPGSHALAGGDCDDLDPGVHPGAPERCDGVDEDCDGEVDEDAVDAPEFYLDYDGDGFGSSRSPVRACEAPPGHVAVAGDCEDWDALVHPGADEVCNNGVDDDCDGSPAPCTFPPDLSSQWRVRWEGNTCGDLLGTAVATGDLNGDGAADLAIGVPRTWSLFPCGGIRPGPGGGGFVEAPRYPGEVRVILGPVWAGVPDVVSTWRGTADLDNAGAALAIGDFDGDGLVDLLVGAPSQGESALPGRVHGVRGPLRDGHHALGDASLLLLGDEVSAGASVALISDFTGDGAVWIAVGGPETAGGAGEMWFLSADRTGTNLLSEADHVVRGGPGDGLGRSVVAIGDLDGDGHPEVAVGAPTADPPEVRLYRGGSDGPGAPLRIRAPGAGHGLGWERPTAGDLDGDGNDDLVLGTWGDPGQDVVPAAWIVWGPIEGDVDLDDALERGAAIRLLADDDVTAAVVPSFVGDVNSDGALDLVAGTWNESGGAALLLLGPVRGSGSLRAGADAIAAGLGGLTGAVVGPAGDLDGDGVPDFVVGAPGATGSTGRKSVGALYLFTGIGF